jgi:hypothetical protein
VFRVLKPGAHLLVCGAPRSFHRMTCGLEDAGFEIRDCLSWLYGQGFPKSLNLGDGQGTALKPGWEPIVLGRKPIKTTVAETVRTHRTGCLQIDASRIPYRNDADFESAKGGDSGSTAEDGPTYQGGWGPQKPQSEKITPLGRWPANVVIDEEAAALLDDMSGELQSGDAHILRRGGTTGRGMGYGSSAAGNVLDATYGDSGGASRFFYVAKPSREERDYGCDHLPMQVADAYAEHRGRRMDEPARIDGKPLARGRNIHPTVKPIALMRWLVRLVTPPGGTVLDPFTGSGTTGMACRYELREFIGIEREQEYVDIATRRIAAVAPLFHEANQQWGISISGPAGGSGGPIRRSADDA